MPRRKVEPQATEELRCRVCQHGDTPDTPLKGPFQPRGALAANDSSAIYVHESCVLLCPILDGQTLDESAVNRVVLMASTKLCKICKTEGASVGCSNEACPTPGPFYHVECLQTTDEPGVIDLITHRFYCGSCEEIPYLCVMCQGGGDTVGCSRCSRCYHENCLAIVSSAPISSDPSWVCPDCTNLEIPMDNMNPSDSKSDDESSVSDTLDYLNKRQAENPAEVEVFVDEDDPELIMQMSSTALPSVNEAAKRVRKRKADEGSESGDEPDAGQARARSSRGGGVACAICDKSSFDLEKCPSCGLRYHFACLGMDARPKGRWACHACQSEKVEHPAKRAKVEVRPDGAAVIKLPNPVMTKAASTGLPKAGKEKDKEKHKEKHKEKNKEKHKKKDKLKEKHKEKDKEKDKDKDRNKPSTSKADRAKQAKKRPREEDDEPQPDAKRDGTVAHPMRASGRKTSAVVRYVEANSDDELAAQVEGAAPEKRSRNRGPEPNHDCCDLCGNGGEIICCDTCPASYHLECARIGAVPQGAWSCPACTGRCDVCLLPTVPPQRIVCRNCNGYYHRACNELENYHNFVCNTCIQFAFDVEMVLTMRTVPVPEELAALRRTKMEAYIAQQQSIADQVRAKQVVERDEAKRQHELLVRAARDNGEAPPPPFEDTLPERPMKLFPIDYPIEHTEVLVKWKLRSHHDNSWVPEGWLARRSPVRVQRFRKKWEAVGWPAEKNVVLASWLIPERIIADFGEGADREFLIKWTDQGYELCTWEHSSAPFITEALIQRFMDIEAFSKSARPPRKAVKFTELTKQPACLPNELHEYQLSGLNFMVYNWSRGVNCILADEMGLGKTVQAISFISTLFHQYNVKGPYLVLGPLSTLPNWSREFAKWAPDINCVTYIGEAEGRAVIRRYEMFMDGEARKADRIPRFHVLLTSYEMILKDNFCFNAIEWEGLIVDEGHRLKNNKSKLFELLSQYNASHRLLLTGTPLQNNLEELFHLMSFLKLSEFASFEDFAMGIGQDQASSIGKLHEMLRPHMLRRMKDDVMKQIPPKAAYLVRVDMTVVQQDLYRNVLTDNFKTLNAEGKVQKMGLQNILMQLQKVCNHPYLFPGSEPEATSREDEMKRLVDASGKFQVLDKLLRKLHGTDHRVLIFSQSTRMLDIIQDYMDFNKFSMERLDGDVNNAERQRSIDRFNAADSTVFAFLLSTRAGRLGINLHTADTVIMYDSDWNPHNDLQAIGRAHRIGQMRKVMVYQLMTRNSVEEKIVERAKKKLVLEHVVVKKMDEDLKEGELDAILRFGAKELFHNDGATGGLDKPAAEETNVQKLSYDDAAIDKLLDRTREDVQDGLTEAAQSEDPQAKLFGALNVAKIWEDDPAPAPAPGPEAMLLSTESLPDEIAADKPSDKDDYWEAILKDRYERMRVTAQESMGKGMRNRRAINYRENMGRYEDDEALFNDEGAEEGATSKRKRGDSFVDPVQDEDGDYQQPVTTTTTRDGNFVPRRRRKVEHRDTPTAGISAGTSLLDQISIPDLRVAIADAMNMTDFDRVTSDMEHALKPYQACEDSAQCLGLAEKQGERYGHHRFAVYPDGYFHCFFPNCGMRMLYSFANHIAAHEENGDAASNMPPLFRLPQDRKSAMKQMTNRQYLMYGVIGTADQSGANQCFFEHCDEQVASTGFAAHIHKHELEGVLPSPVVFFHLVERKKTAQQDAILAGVATENTTAAAQSTGGAVYATGTALPPRHGSKQASAAPAPAAPAPAPAPAASAPVTAAAMAGGMGGLAGQQMAYDPYMMANFANMMNFNQMAGQQIGQMPQMPPMQQMMGGMGGMSGMANMTIPGFNVNFGQGPGGQGGDPMGGMGGW